MKVQIDVYSDVVCPWCFIGTRRLQNVLDSIDGAGITVRHHPFILQPDAPQGGLDLHRMLFERYGTDPAAMFARVEAAARETGIPLDLSKQRMTYSTAAAHTLLRHAAEKKTQSALLQALFVAYFLDARNIADTTVLADVATNFGFTVEEVKGLVTNETELNNTLREAEDAQRRGIRGVPLFIFGPGMVLPGAQQTDTLREAIDRARGVLA